MSGLSKIISAAFKNTKFVYSTGGNRGTFFDAFIKYNSSPAPIHRLSRTILSSAEKQQDNVRTALNNVCGDLGKLEVRVKSLEKTESKVSKLIKDLKQDEAVRLVSSGSMQNIIGDGLGARITLAYPRNQRILMQRLQQAQSDNMFLQTVENYHGKGVCPYFSKRDLKELRKLEYKDAKGKQCGVVTHNEIKSAGYTRANSDMVIAGQKVEFQIGGPFTIKFGEVEHYLYDMRRIGKVDLSKLSESQKELFYSMKQSYLRVYKNPEMNSNYNKYLTKVWKTLKDAESSGVFPQLPQLPQGIPKVLSVENLLKLEYTA